MTDVGETESRTEAVGVFEDAASLQAAIDDLLTAGFDRAELSLLADEATVERKLGHAYAKPAELEDDPQVPRTAYVSTEARGDAQGGLIGALVYVGAVAAAGAVVASGGTLAAEATQVVVGDHGLEEVHLKVVWRGSAVGPYAERSIVVHLHHRRPGQ